MNLPTWTKNAEIKIFPAALDPKDCFSALTDCTKWLIENGFEYGSTQALAPFGVCKKEKVNGFLPKWRYIDTEDRENFIDGLVIYNRGQRATLYLKKH